MLRHLALLKPCKDVRQKKATSDSSSVVAPPISTLISMNIFIRRFINAKWSIGVILTLALFSSLSLAGNKALLVYSGRLVTPSGTAENAAGVIFNYQIVAPNGCLLWQETSAPVNMTSSAGAFTSYIGGTANTSGNGLTWSQVFQNGVPLAGLSGTGCPGTYTGTATDDRTLFVSFNDGTGLQSLTGMAIKASAQDSMLAGFPVYMNGATPGAGMNGQMLAFNWNGGSPYWSPSVAGGGGLTSITLNMPAAVFTSPPAIVANGVYSWTLNSQAANTVWAAPNGAPGAPTFRTLVSADLPTVGIAQGGTGQVTANAALNALLPSQGGNSGLFLTTNGANASWSAVTSGINQLTGDVTAGPGTGSQAATVASVGGASAASVAAAATAVAAATSANTPSTLVMRDGSGNFSAGTITASLTGAASLNVLKAGDTMTGPLVNNSNVASPALAVSQANAAGYAATFMGTGGGTSGRVGIGTVAPTELAEFSSSDTNVYSSSSGAVSTPWTLGNAAVINIRNTGNTTGIGSFIDFSPQNAGGGQQRAWIGAVAPAVSYGSSLVFGMRTGANAYNERMRIDGSTGNVGIGTTIPASLLNVSAAPTASANFGLFSLGNGGWAGGGAPNFTGSAAGTEVAVNSAAGFGGNLMDLQVGGVSKFSIDAAGNVVQVGGISSTTFSGTGNITTTGNISTTGAGTITANGTMLASAGTASTSPTTGALIVTGGVGISGALNIGGTALFQPAVNSTTAFQVQDSGNSVALSVDTTADSVTVGKGGLYILRSDGNPQLAHIDENAAGQIEFSNNLKFSTAGKNFIYNQNTNAGYIDVGGAPGTAITFGTAAWTNIAGGISGLTYNQPNITPTLAGYTYNLETLSGTVTSTAAVTQNGLTATLTDNSAAIANTLVGLNVDVSAGTNATATRYAAILKGGNVGIGTAAPVGQLNVLQATDNANQGIQISRTGANTGAMWVSAATNTFNLGRQVAGNVAIAIDNSQNVGINTATPSAKLNVMTSAGTFNAVLQNSNSTNGDIVGLGFKDGSDTGNLNSLKGALLFERTAGNGRGKMHIAMNGVNDTSTTSVTDAKLTVNYDGTVGVGTTSPNAVLSTGVVTGAGEKTAIEFQDSTTATNASRIRVDGSNDQGMIMDLDYNSNSNFDYFQVRHNANQSMLYIDNKARVAVGTNTSPTAAMHLPAGTAAAGTAPLKLDPTGAVLLGTAEAGAIEFDGTNLYFTDNIGPTRQTIATTTTLGSYVPLAGGTMTGALINNTNNASPNAAVAVTQSGTGNAATFMGGNVGIGTTTPVADGRLTVSKAGGTKVYVQDSTAAVDNKNFFLQSATGVLTIGSENDADSVSQGLWTYTGSTDKAFFNVTALGVGTANPLSKFDVAGGVAIGSYAGANAAPANGMIASGNVGVGTTTPNGALQVGDATTTAATSMVILGRTAASTQTILPRIHQMSSDGISNELAIGAASSTGGIHFFTGNVTGQTSLLGTNANTEKMTILNSGNVGIGTTAPAGGLQVGDPTTVATNSMLLLGKTTAATEVFLPRMHQFSSNGTMNDLAIGAASTSGGIHFFTGNISGQGGLLGSNVNTEKMTILNSGNVGIGTTAPTAVLHIAGSNNFTPASGGASLFLVGNYTSTDTATAASGTVPTVNLDNFASGTLAATNTGVITTSANAVRIGGGVSAGTNETITNTNALFINGAALTGAITNSYGLNVMAGSGATNNYAATFMNGNVGIGTTAPTSTLDVNGAIVSEAQANAAGVSKMVFSTGNVQTSANSTLNQAFKLCGMQPGGSYSLVLTAQPLGSTPTFTAYTDAACTNPIANFDAGGTVLTTTSATTIFTFIYAGNTVYAMIATGFTM